MLAQKQTIPAMARHLIAWPALLFTLVLATNSALAASYDLEAQQNFSSGDINSPPGIRARVTTLPDGRIKPGDTIRFVIRIYNDNTSPAGGINISFIPDTNVAELVAAKPLLDFASDYITQWQASGWNNITVPARGSRDFSISYRVHPSQALGSQLKFTAWVGQDDYQFDRYFSVPIADKRGNRAAVNNNPVDNFFRVAAGRWPTAAERTQWNKRYREYQTNRAFAANLEDRLGLFIKEIARKITKGKTLGASTVVDLFHATYGRVPTAAEKQYWLSRVKDKATSESLTGAMAYHHARGKSPKVLGAKSNDIFRLEITDNHTDAAPGELVTVKITIRNVLHGDQIDLATDVSAQARNLDVSAISDQGKVRRWPGETKGGTIDWSAIQFFYNVPRPLTFKVKVPDKSFGDQFCTKGTVYAAHGRSLQVLTAEDCTTINPKKKVVISTPLPPAKPTLKITAKDFNITGPDSLNTDRADQEITWYATDKIKATYPNVKIELCPGKDFKDCIILDAIVENDSRHIINMPPVPRTGKWYLHIIGRDRNNGLAPNVAAAKRIELHK